MGATHDSTCTISDVIEERKMYHITSHHITNYHVISSELASQRCAVSVNTRKLGLLSLIQCV